MKDLFAKFLCRSGTVCKDVAYEEISSGARKVHPLGCGLPFKSNTFINNPNPFYKFYKFFCFWQCFGIFVILPETIPDGTHRSSDVLSVFKQDVGV